MSYLIWLAAFAVLLELGLRIVTPKILRRARNRRREMSESPFLFGSEFGYETKPNATFTYRDYLGDIHTAQLNNEGFYGDDIPLSASPGEVRIAAVGDSVVQAFPITRPFTWTEVLQRRMNESVGAGKSVTVINAGVGGYTSSQLVQRLERRVLKYRPEMVLVHVGWNDLTFASLPTWKPRVTLSDLEKADTKQPQQIEKPSLKRRVANWAYNTSYAIDLIGSIRNTRGDEKRRDQVIRSRQSRSEVAFNQKALDIYSENLEKIYECISKSGARMVLLTSSTILAPGLFNDFEINKKLYIYFANFPLSAEESYEWLLKYNEARRSCARNHPDIILVDLFEAFSGYGREDRLRLFSDLAHLTNEGNDLMARFVQEKIASQLSGEFRLARIG